MRLLYISYFLVVNAISYSVEEEEKKPQCMHVKFISSQKNGKQLSCIMAFGLGLRFSCGLINSYYFTIFA